MLPTITADGVAEVVVLHEVVDLPAVVLLIIVVHLDVAATHMEEDVVLGILITIHTLMCPARSVLRRTTLRLSVGVDSMRIMCLTRDLRELLPPMVSTLIGMQIPVRRIIT
jgi:hypothetical protein